MSMCLERLAVFVLMCIVAFILLWVCGAEVFVGSEILLGPLVEDTQLNGDDTVFYQRGEL